MFVGVELYVACDGEGCRRRAPIPDHEFAHTQLVGCGYGRAFALEVTRYLPKGWLWKTEQDRPIALCPEHR